jgi:hypothetical protein
MTGKLSALGSNLYYGTADLSGDIGAVSQVEGMRGTFDVTAINASAMERIVGRRDGAMAFNAFWNVDSASRTRRCRRCRGRTSSRASSSARPPSDSPTASMTSKQMNYAGAVGQDGSLGATVSLEANGFGLEWGELLTTGKQSFSTGTVNGTSINLGSVSTLFGAAGYLHVFSVASGTATFAIQDSDDDATFVDVTGLVFTAATGATAERLQTAAGATIRQYVRLQGRGVHGAAVVAANFVRYTEAGPI